MPELGGIIFGHHVLSGKNRCLIPYYAYCGKFIIQHNLNNLKQPEFIFFHEAYSLKIAGSSDGLCLNTSISSTNLDIMIITNSLWRRKGNVNNICDDF